MAESSRVNSSTATAQPSRLQRRRPASLHITPSSWNAAIPLLSPLATSPPPLDFKSNELSAQTQHQRSSVGNSSSTSQENLVFKKWQHPAAPFCYDSASFNPKFIVPV